MKKTALALMLLFAFPLFAQNVKVPAKVKDAFSKLYPKIASVKWDKESAKEYEASFKDGVNECTAAFDPAGNLLETEIQVATTTLPSTASDFIKAKHPGFTIDKVFKITNSKKEVTFEAEIKKGKKMLEVSFMQDGKPIVKKGAPEKD